VLVALHGTPMDFCHGKLIFWCTDASASWTSMPEWSSQYCYFMLEIHGACFHSYILHFLSYHTVGQKLVAMTYRGSIYLYVCMYMSAHVCLHACTSHVPNLCLDRFWISFCLQLYTPNLQHGTVHWLSSSALQYFNSAVLGMSCLHLLSYVDSLTHLTQHDFMLDA
jgi:hypothetical protein